MAISRVTVGVGDGDAAIGSDTDTKERGFLVRVTNQTGETSVKGKLVSASTTTDNAVILQANEYDAFGVIQQAGIAVGNPMWIWVNGSICQVLFENGIGITRGNIAICSDVDGRADNVSNPGTGLPGVDIHFKEIGHVMESKDSGTDVMALVMIHFN
jgi:hypothetical protein